MTASGICGLFKENSGGRFTHFSQPIPHSEQSGYVAASTELESPADFNSLGNSSALVCTLQLDPYQTASPPRKRTYM